MASSSRSRTWTDQSSLMMWCMARCSTWRLPARRITCTLHKGRLRGRNADHGLLGGSARVPPGTSPPADAAGPQERARCHNWGDRLHGAAARHPKRRSQVVVPAAQRREARSSAVRSSEPSRRNARRRLKASLGPSILATIHIRRCAKESCVSVLTRPRPNGLVPRIRAPARPTRPAARWCWHSNRQLGGSIT